jgi:hypothetical protein
MRLCEIKVDKICKKYKKNTHIIFLFIIIYSFSHKVFIRSVLAQSHVQKVRLEKSNKTGKETPPSPCQTE